MIFFRSDASSIIGTGHVMRCLTLAKALRKLGKKCQFICRDNKGNLIEKIRQEGFDVRVILDSKRIKLKNNSDNYNLIHAKWLKTIWQVDAKETIKLLISIIQMLNKYSRRVADML